MLEFLIVDEGRNVCRVPLYEVHPVDIKRVNTCLSTDQIWGKKERKKDVYSKATSGQR